MDIIEQKILQTFNQLKIPVRKIEHTAGPEVSLYKVFIEYYYSPWKAMLHQEDFKIKGLRITVFLDYIAFEVPKEEE